MLHVPLPRLVEKAHARRVAIDRASSSVTELIFHQQSVVKQRILDQIALSGREERDALRFWRKLILHNTHPRYVSLDTVIYTGQSSLPPPELYGVVMSTVPCVGNWTPLRAQVGCAAG